MIDVEVTENAIGKARGYQVTKKFEKQLTFLRINPKYNSLKFEPVKSLRGIYRFRVDKHYWGLVTKTGVNRLKVYDVIKHLK